MPTSIKDAMKLWEEMNKANIAEAVDVRLSFQWPPIEKMDNSLAALNECQLLSLSTNMIEKITGLSSMRNLKILSLGRNKIKTLAGLEPLADTLEELWISYNFIEKLKGVSLFKSLTTLYISFNLVKDSVEFARLREIPKLEDLAFVGNPLCENVDEMVWRKEVAGKLPTLKKLDGDWLIRV